MAGGAYGGAETFFEDLAAAFARAGVRQRAVIRPAPAREAKLTAAGIAVDTLPFGGPLDLYTPWRLRRIAAAERPDVVLGWMNRACRVLPRGPFARIGRLGGYYDLKYYRRCDALICNTRDIRDYVIRAGWPAARAHYIPNFCPALPEPALPRASFGTPAAARILLILARLEETKGIDIAIAALRRIPDAVLWIAGEGGLRDALQRQTVDDGVAARVRFLGWRADRGALLKAADAVLVPSRHEPFGNVIVNAWVHDVPVVAAASEGPRALIEHGSDGLLVPVGDAAALADAVSALLARPDARERLIAGGRAKAAAEYSETAVVRGYLEVFRALADRR